MAAKTVVEFIKEYRSGFNPITGQPNSFKDLTDEMWRHSTIKSVEENGNSLQQLKAEILSLLQQAIREIDGGKYYDAVPPLELAVAKLSAI